MKNIFRKKKPYKQYIWYAPIALILMVGLYYLPPIHSRLAWRIDEARTRIKYFFNPPDQATFQPQKQEGLDFNAILATTRAEYMMTLTPQVTSTPAAGPTLTPTITTTPLPASVTLDGVKYEDQHNRWNYCGPANFSMALTFWGWKGNRDIVGKAVKPSDKDRNVMPYELQDFISNNVPGMSSVMRYGGDIDLVKRLLSSGYPLVIEKGYYELDYTGKIGWMGHYQFVTGYDEAKREVLVQDTYNDGPNFHINYDEFMEGWRSFDYLFVVVYPVDREDEVLGLLGDLADADVAARKALDRAKKEVNLLTGNDQFWAAFNVGTSHVALREYVDAAYAFDYAFSLYADLSSDLSSRPYRVMWYQTSPYYAYYYSNRYADVINLADTTLNDTVSEPVLEESLLWRGRAYYMAGDTQSAIDDYRASLKVHPKWPPALQALQDLGIQP
jgi:tetratricopeptide (TPR) repeat protein